MEEPLPPRLEMGRGTQKSNIKVNLNALFKEAEKSNGINSRADFQKLLQITDIASGENDLYIVLEPEIQQKEQRVPKTTPIRSIASMPTPRRTPTIPYERKAIPERPGPEYFSVDLDRVRKERPNQRGRTKAEESSYDVKELKDILASINKYIGERNKDAPKLRAGNRDELVAAIRGWFEAPEEPTEMETLSEEPEEKPKKKTPKGEETEEVTKPKVSLKAKTGGKVSLKSKAAAKKGKEEVSESESESELTKALGKLTLKPRAKSAAESESEEEIKPLPPKIKKPEPREEIEPIEKPAAKTKTKAKPKITKKIESESESESEGRSEEKPAPKKGLIKRAPLAKSKR
jgi:hypothetical protein